MDFMQGLNKEQKAAVLTDKQYVRVIAGAGSGKTRVLTTRIIYLIKDLGYYPSSICAITFTNKAANEMKERMERMLPEAIRVHTSTIHALCVRIIREEYEAVGLIRNFTIIDTADQQSVLREAYRTLEYDRKSLPYREVLNYISNNKIANVSVEQARKLAGSNYYEQQKASVYKFYVDRLRDLYALDFDDLLIKVNDLLRTHEVVRQKWQRRFRVVLVDEFQDVDHIQYGIVTSLVGEDNELYVVGDPDQTIYTWRGANVDFIVDFEKKFPESETIVLNQNYRSTQHILDRANRLISCNQNRPHKDLHANKQSDFDVVYESFDDVEAESYWIVRKIEELKEETGSYLNTAVLYRSNYLSRSIEKVLMARHIPYVIYGGLRFYDHAEVKDMMSYLRMITHGDDLALRRSVASPRRGIGEKTLDNFADRAALKGASIFEIMEDDVALGTASPKVKAYVNLIHRFRSVASTSTLEEIMKDVLKHSGLVQHFEKQEEFERIENLKELVSDAHHFEQNYDEPDLESYIQMVSLYGDKNEVVEGDYVRLMTVHAAKGLEFENVIIMGVSDNVFPNKNAVIDGIGGIQEERRLMYVAITRAKNRLYVTNNTGFSFVSGMYSKPSRFIQEMGVHEIKENEGLNLSSLAKETFSQFETSHGVGVKAKKLKKADLVIHDDFGEGIVISVDEDADTMRIAFNFPHGTKTISRKFTGLRKKESMS